MRNCSEWHFPLDAQLKDSSCPKKAKSVGNHNKSRGLNVKKFPNLDICERFIFTKPPLPKAHKKWVLGRPHLYIDAIFYQIHYPLLRPRHADARANGCASNCEVQRSKGPKF